MILLIGLHPELHNDARVVPLLFSFSALEHLRFDLEDAFTLQPSLRIHAKEIGHPRLSALGILLTRSEL
jgi:hypothetical protein